MGHLRSFKPHPQRRATDKHFVVESHYYFF